MTPDKETCQAITEALRTQGGRAFIALISNNFDRTMRELLNTTPDKVEWTRGRAKALQEILKTLQDIETAATR